MPETTNTFKKKKKILKPPKPRKAKAQVRRYGAGWRRLAQPRGRCKPRRCVRGEEEEEEEKKKEKEEKEEEEEGQWEEG